MIRRGGLARRMLALALIMSALPVAVVLVVTLANREVLDEQLRLGEAVLPVVQSAEGVAAGAEQIAILVLQLSDAADVADVERIGHLLERRVAEVYTASVPAADVQQVVAMIRRMRASARASVTASAAFERAVLAAVEVSRRLAAAAEQSRVSLSMRAPVVARLAVSDVERFAADLRIMLDRLRASLEPEALREELLPLSRTATLRLGELRDAGLTVRLAEHLHDLSRYTGRLRAHGGDDVFALRGEAIRARGELLDVRGVVDVELQRLRDLVAARVDGAYRELADSGTRSVAAVQSAERIGSWVALGLVLVSAAGAWFYLRATVVTRFERLIESMGRIASGDVDGGGTEGDPRGDELARIEHAVSVFRERSRELLLKTEDLQQSEEQLRLANEDLQQFVYHASHDLRAPMRAIGALTSQLLEEGVPDSDARRSLELIRGRAVRLDRLVDDLLTYS
ncbi:MAG: hypothetical protein KAI24_23400, partial [Planctomycetes bacterium]|nr:hypothetical protein [Planctomycetota bacterium]